MELGSTRERDVTAASQSDRKLGVEWKHPGTSVPSVTVVPLRLAG